MDIEQTYSQACKAHDEGDLATAEPLYREVLKHGREELETLRNLGILCSQQGRFKEAQRWLRLALAFYPANALVMCSLAAALMSEGREDEALQLFDQALTIYGDIPQARWNRALLRLRAGDFTAWDEFRWGRVVRKEPARSLKPEWDGGLAEGKTIFVWSEQGQGDTIQLVRLVKDLKERSGAHVVLEVQRPLTTFLQQVEGADEVIARDPHLRCPPHDLHLSLCDLPFKLGLRLEDVKGGRYLHADQELLDEWQERLPDRPIGVVWRGSATHGADQYRSIPAEQFKTAFERIGERVVSLQCGPGAAEWWGEPEDDLSPLLVDWTETAAAIVACALVVTVDTAVAHLAGALGVPCWVLIAEPSDFRWLTERTDSPWYDSVRLFRQAPGGAHDWGPVLAEVNAALVSRASAKVTIQAHVTPAVQAREELARKTDSIFLHGSAIIRLGGSVHEEALPDSRYVALGKDGHMHAVEAPDAS